VATSFGHSSNRRGRTNSSLASSTLTQSPTTGVLPLQLKAFTALNQTELSYTQVRGTSVSCYSYLKPLPTTETVFNLRGHFMKFTCPSRQWRQAAIFFSYDYLHLTEMAQSFVKMTNDAFSNQSHSSVSLTIQ